jgi:16S rRNA processing protein RimM
LLDMGRVAGSYGIRGWLKVAPGGGVAAALSQAREWWIGERPYVVAEAKLHGAGVVAKLEGIESREQALALKGARVSMPREALPELSKGHYYLVDLLGLEVLNEQGERLGAIAQWITNGAQDVMEVAGERTRLIPWVSAIVKRVDLERRQVVVDWSADW